MRVILYVHLNVPEPGSSQTFQHGAESRLLEKHHRQCELKMCWKKLESIKAAQQCILSMSLPQKYDSPHFAVQMAGLHMVIQSVSWNFMDVPCLDI